MPDAPSLMQYASIVLAIVALVGTIWQKVHERRNKVTDDIVARVDRELEAIRQEQRETKRELAIAQSSLLKVNLEHSACREENAELRAELADARGEIGELQAKVAALEGRAA
jgi:peptidoglycan hydrolase CwlO-like protein